MKEHKDLYFQIGERIKKARKASGLTQEKLAAYVDVSVQYISDLERGVVGTSIPTLIKICKVLHVSSDYILMDRQNDPEESDLYQKITHLSPREKELLDRSVQILMESFAFNEK